MWDFWVSISIFTTLNSHTQVLAAGFSEFGRSGYNLSTWSLPLKFNRENSGPRKVSEGCRRESEYTDKSVPLLANLFSERLYSIPAL